jgi:hypothetical protein
MADCNSKISAQLVGSLCGRLCQHSDNRYRSSSGGRAMLMATRRTGGEHAQTEVSTRDRLHPLARTKQAYPRVGVFLLATGGKVQAVIAVEWGNIMVCVGTVENCALAVRQ